MKKCKLPPVSEYDNELCTIFANACVKTNRDEYDRRNQSNVGKVRSDIRNGKLAEIMVYSLFMKRGARPFPIDFLIYEAKNKSFDADIYTRKKNIHVKSCLDDGPFPNSWLFQPWDSLVSNPQDKDVLALVVIRNKKPSYCYIMNATDAVYGDPVKKSLNKKVIYEEGLNGNS